MAVGLESLESDLSMLGSRFFKKFLYIFGFSIFFRINGPFGFKATITPKQGYFKLNQLRQVMTYKRSGWLVGKLRESSFEVGKQIFYTVRIFRNTRRSKYAI